MAYGPFARRLALWLGKSCHNHKAKRAIRNSYKPGNTLEEDT